FSSSVPSCTAYIIHFSLIPRPPKSPLFPYTTLFRSPRWCAGPSHLATSRPSPGIPGDACPRALPHRARSVEPEHRGTPHGPHRTDRKSTRLNSSHVKISYAVFCLKKKKKHTICNIHV